MQLASGSHIPDGLLAANALLSEKLHQGFAAPKSTLHQGFGVSISSTPLGIISPLYDDGIGSRYTGKERDTESGLDYFGARYYASNMGRFMSPDWSAKAEPVPYSKLDNPQSLNLYAYEFNNPLGGVDADGHGCGGPGEAPCPTAQQIGQDPTLPNAVAPPPPTVEQRLNSVADTVEGALFPKTWGDMASLALSVPTDGLASMAGALPRVMELSSAMGKTADYVTLAVTETKEGTKVVSSSENALRPAVKALLKDGEVAAKGAGHAEVTGVNAAKQMGLTPTGVAASRGICPSCAATLKAAGVAALSALKQYF